MNFEEFKSKYQKKDVQEVNSSVHRRPMVSICVQTFQHVNFIKDCLDGILKQKCDFPFEILLGEDQSTDGTREICVKYAKKHPNKIRLFLHQRENNIAIGEKPTGRFNLLYNLFSAKGQYIAICEGDDFWIDPFKLQRQVDFLQTNKNYIITFHNANILNEIGEITQESKLLKNFKKDCTGDTLKKGAFLLTLTLCFRNVIKDIPIEICKVLNGDTFLISLLGHYGKGKYMPEIKPAVFRKHNGGIWTSKKFLQKKLSSLHTYFALSHYYQKTSDSDIINYFRNKILQFSKPFSEKNCTQKDQLFFYYRAWEENKNLVPELAECFLERALRFSFHTRWDFIVIKLCLLLLERKNFKTALIFLGYHYIYNLTRRGEFLRRNFMNRYKFREFPILN